MADPRTDRELVAAHVGGDRAALGAIYDRYAPGLHDTAAAMLRDPHEAADATHDVFVSAAAHFAQLRDPDRLKAWLFAILRHEVYRRTKRRSRQQVLAMDELPERAAVDARADASEAEALELAALVRAAAAGLDERDQLVLELSVRQNLHGTDLAAALGLTPSQCHVVVHRMRDRVQRSLGALVVARAGRRDCASLDELLRGWDGRYTTVIRKRVARHIDECRICMNTRRRFAVFPLFGSAPAFALPLGLRDRVLDDATTPGAAKSYRFSDEDGFPKAARRARRRVLAAAALVAIVALFAGAVASLGGRGSDDAVLAGAAVPATSTATPTAPSTSSATVAPTASTVAPTLPTVPTSPPTTDPPITATSIVSPPATSPATTSATLPPTSPATTSPPTGPVTTAPAPGQLQLSAAVVDLGANAPSARLVLTNTGGAPVTWETVGTVAPFTLAPARGTLDPGTNVAVVASLNRVPLGEGDLSRSFSVTSSGAGGGRVTVRASVERAPVVAIVRAVATLNCPWSVNPMVVVTVSDESPLRTVELSWSGPGPSGSVAMTQSSGAWSGRLGLARVGGTWRWTVTATDVRGNRGTAAGTIVVTGC